MRKKQDHRCADCRTEEKFMPVHHMVPQKYGGSDNEENAKALCSDRRNGCYQKWDRIFDEKGEIFPGIPVEKASSSLFKTPEARKTVLEKFGRG